MNKLVVDSTEFDLAPASHSDLERAHRLIVLFPSSEPEGPDLENRIWELARSMHLDVLIISLTHDYDEEEQLRRKLITMAAMIKDPFVATDILIEHGYDWVGQVKKIWRAGDVVACYQNHKVGILRKPLDQILRSSLNVPVHILAEIQPVQNLKPIWLSRLIFWLGAMGTISSFFWAEVQLINLPQDWAHSALVYVCVFVELALLAVWNSLFT
jgi:hypothetical protein